MQVLVTGAAGRLGRILRTTWAGCRDLEFEPRWSSRQAGHPGDLVWDILSDPAPFIARGSAILHLAGVVQGDSAALSQNSALAKAVCAAGFRAGARHVFLASSAAVYGPGPHDHVEVQAPAPQTAYGRAKLAMERDALCWARDAGPDAPGVTCLRIGNVLGCDRLFGGAAAAREVVLDPVPGQSGGPIRSYIGPGGLAQVLEQLLVQLAQGTPMPRILNVALPDPVAMADLLRAAALPFHFGQPNSQVIPRVGLSTKRLAGLVSLQPADAAALVADWRQKMADAE